MTVRRKGFVAFPNSLLYRRISSDIEDSCWFICWCWVGAWIALHWLETKQREYDQIAMKWKPLDIGNSFCSLCCSIIHGLTPANVSIHVSPHIVANTKWATSKLWPRCSHGQGSIFNKCFHYIVANTDLEQAPSGQGCPCPAGYGRPNTTS